MDRINIVKSLNKINNNLTILDEMVEDKNIKYSDKLEDAYNSIYNLELVFRNIDDIQIDPVRDKTRFIYLLGEAWYKFNHLNGITCYIYRAIDSTMKEIHNDVQENIVMIHNAIIKYISDKYNKELKKMNKAFSLIGGLD